MFFSENTTVPNGYTYGEIFGQETHDLCISKIIEEGKVILDYCIYLKDE